MYREKRERDSGWESEAIGSPMLMFHEVMWNVALPQSNIEAGENKII